MKENLRAIIAIIFLLTAMIACKKENITPDISLSSRLITVAEDVQSSAVDISIRLSEPSDEVINIDYNTEDSTAFAGKNYIAVNSGKLSIQPGETSGIIKVNILADTAGKQDTYFRVILGNPVNATLRRSVATIMIRNVDYATLVWSDEFTSGPLNAQVWNYEQGAGGWGNNELQTYTSSTNNVHLDSGFLHITVLNPSPAYYTSGRITTQSKKEITYGKIKIRARLPQGKGIWPALWMLGANFSTVSWPKCGEIDMMELLGQAPSVVYGALHWDSNGHTSRTNSYTLTTGSFSSDFHVFTMTWTPNNLKWAVDDYQFFSLSRSEVPDFPFDLPQFFIFNVAVGGNWPGNPDATTTFPQHMIIDYIRLYQ